jgi:hypothetical protein
LLRQSVGEDAEQLLHVIGFEISPAVLGEERRRGVDEGSTDVRIVTDGIEQGVERRGHDEYGGGAAPGCTTAVL